MSDILDVSWDLLNDNGKEETVELLDVSQALIKSLQDLARVDINYISEYSGLTKDEVISSLKGVIYRNPIKFRENYYEGFELSDEYLSGNIYKKLEEARIAEDKYHIFEENIEVLTKLMPAGVKADKIYYTLSSPWISSNLILEFIKHLYRMVGLEDTKIDEYTLRHDTFTQSYEVNLGYMASNLLNIHYGTSARSVEKLLSSLLNNKKVQVFDYINTGKKNKKAVLNKSETLLAANICETLNSDFHKFIESSLDYIDTLQEDYNKKYGYIINRAYNGDFLKFPNLNPKEHLFNYQKNAVARILFNKNTLLAHNVGAGKTYIMVSAGEELIRTNLSKKNLYVVPNSIVIQWSNIYKSLYPNSNLLVIEANDFTPKKKEKTLKKIKDFELGSIIMPYSVFDKIVVSKAIELNKLYDELNEIVQIKDVSKITKELEKKKLDIQDRISEIKAGEINELEDYTFDKLGIDRLFLDEAHNYKNLAVNTSFIYDGLSISKSVKCQHLLEVCDYLNSLDKGIIFATGTPITNSICDCYVIERYLQPGELKLLDIYEFDQWIGMFAESSDEVEVDVNTNCFRLRSRFSKFHNLTELTQILSNISDFHFNKNDKGLPKFNGYTNIELKESTELRGYLNYVATRIDSIKNGAVDRKTDNMLKVTIDARKAALDLRLIDNVKYSFVSYNKVFECANQVYDVYKKTSDKNLTQIIFCDSSTPSDKFNVYDEMKKLLMDKGIPEEEIEFIHDATSETAKEKMFDEFNQGIIRILIGSTFKLGTGVNVQKKLYAIHHLDIPWRPSDMVQREGRIIRPQNSNEEVFIYKYIQKASFDAYSWQLLEIKQNFINALLSNSLTQRSLEDVEDTKLNYAEAKALAVGNPSVKDYLELNNELNKLKLTQKREDERVFTNKAKLISLNEQVDRLRKEIEDLKLDVQVYSNNNIELSEEIRSELRNKIWDLASSERREEADEFIANYKGFDLYVPKHTLTNQKRIDIKCFGEYHVFLETNLGTLTKIDNQLSHLVDRLNMKEKELSSKKDTIDTINSNLDKKFDNSVKISELEERLELLNKKLKG